MGREQSIGFSPWMIVGVGTLAVGAYVYQFHCHEVSSDPAEWGQLGDYLGGILNPIIAFGALLWLVASVNIQRRELTETKYALRESMDAQKHQADTSLLAARIGSLNVELTSVINRLQNLRARQGYISELQNRPDRPATFINELHEPISIIVMAATTHGTISALEEEEERILKEIKDISAGFRKATYATYAN